MNKIYFLVIFFLIIISACSQMKDTDIVLFDIKTTQDESILPQFGGSIVKTDSILEIKTPGNDEFPGVQISGMWDLSGYTLTLEFVNYDTKDNIPIIIRLENPESIPDKETGVLIDRSVFLPPGSSKHTISIPTKLPLYPEIGEKLSSGMLSKGRNPYSFPLHKISRGFVFNLDPKKVTKLVVYINRPNHISHWGIKGIVAKKIIPLEELPEYMQFPEDKFFPFIDIYGQFIHKDWPGKTNSDNDLKEALNNELTELQHNNGPTDRDQYGGWLSGPRQKATGSFYVKKIEGKWWMVDPDGFLFWSHGVNRVTTSSAVTPLDNRKFYFKDLPQDSSKFAEFYFTNNELMRTYFERWGVKETYDFSASNIKRKYGENWREKYAEMTHNRLRSWGLNTIANSSDKYIYLQAKTPYCDRINLNSPDIAASKGGWWPFRDPFHPEFRTSLSRRLSERKNELDDPMCLGFFIDNELSWGGPTSLAEWTLQSPSNQPAKIEIINLLKKKYTRIEKLNDAWKSNYKNWEAMLISIESPPVSSKDDCIKLTDIITEEYFKNIREVLKKVAPNKLYMGSRFSGSRESVVRISAKYVDILSYNVYKYSLSEFNLPDGIDKPVIIGEFHFGALDRGLFHTGLREVADQVKRGEAYKTYVESGLRHPNIVGTHWFQFSDQATTGRFDGENYQIGLIDVCDMPYPETIEKIREVGYNMYTIRNVK